MPELSRNAEFISMYIATWTKPAHAAPFMVRPRTLPEDIWRIDLATGKLQQVVEPKLDSPSLSWTRDGKTLFVFGGRGLFAIDPAKNSMKRVADGEFYGQIDWLATK